LEKQPLSPTNPFLKRLPENKYYSGGDIPGENGDERARGSHGAQHPRGHPEGRPGHQPLPGPVNFRSLPSCWGFGFRVSGFEFLASGSGAVNIRNLQGYLTHKKTTPPLEPPYGLRCMLLQGPRWGQFLMSEVPLYPLIGASGFGFTPRISQSLT